MAKIKTKWWWRVRVDKDSLWASVINDIHGNLGGTKDLRQNKSPSVREQFHAESSYNTRDRNKRKIAPEAKRLLKEKMEETISFNARKLKNNKKEVGESSKSKDRRPRCFICRKRGHVCRKCPQRKHCLIPTTPIETRRVGNGESICFWDDVWLGSSCLSHMFPRLFELETDKLCKLKERCSISDGVTEWKWAWRRQIRSGREQEELSSLLSIVGNSSLTNDDRDGWRWSVPVKSLRAALDEKILPTSSETKWSSLVPKKVCVFIWRAEKDRLPTRLNLDKRNIDLDSLLCPFCEDSCEDLEHSMIACARVNSMPVEINIHALLSLVSDMSDHKKKMFHPFQLKCFEAVIFTAAWVIWNARNRKIFSSIDHTTEWCFSEVQRHSFCWISSRGKVNLNWDEWVANPFSSCIPNRALC
ncbi:RNA-directed DNA polymerase, eukaryota, Reverse transcriptase zinc-binding domain protein [Artemisia annua]|uniref:RNA-directed DNA polymerase, eukaryota, Reverse transcriptase zinc-binding domain protein n=1 Tax=Artemisia annua TaxID=35608 RepID=A0A2U1QCN5_ARTAN|nr:RNA-directed DNA polymerase, eukaryota, Reverse transcriptase zinc-binding domain protein [Artemisia annua]